MNAIAKIKTVQLYINSLIKATCLNPWFVTSRPATAADLDERVLTKRIETFGFSKEQTLEYIDNFPFANSSLESTSDCSYSSNLKEYCIIIQVSLTC